MQVVLDQEEIENAIITYVNNKGLPVSRTHVNVEMKVSQLGAGANNVKQHFTATVHVKDKQEPSWPLPKLMPGDRL